MHGSFECPSSIFLSFYYQTEEIASGSFSLIKKWKSISPDLPPPPFTFFFISFTLRHVWWMSFAYVKLPRSIFIVSSIDFCAGRSLPERLHVLDFVCMCFYLCLCNNIKNILCADICWAQPVLLCFSRCLSCVSSPWGCQWNTLDHTCSDKDDSITGSTIIGHRNVSPCKARVTIFYRRCVW